MGCQWCSSTANIGHRRGDLKEKQLVIIIVACQHLQLPIYREITAHTHLSLYGQCNVFLWHTIVCQELLVAATLWSLYCCFFN